MTEERIAILTDSSCDIDQNTLRKYGIFMVPLRVIYKDRNEEFRDGIDITPQEVYDRMPGVIPTTSLPSPSDVISVLEEIRSKGFTHVVAVHISSGLSGTINMIKQVSTQVKELAIEVVDSKSLSMGLGYPVLEAARAVAEKANMSSVLEKVHDAMKKARVYYVLETLDYLKKGGRIGKVAGTIGELLNIKPIISIDADGTYFTYAKVRGRNKSIDKLLEVVRERVSKGFYRVAVLHGGAAYEAEELLAKVKALPNIREIVSGQISPALGVHTGPGLVGIALLPDN